MSNWQCGAITNSVTVYPDGIAPCCMISSEYRKPLSEISNRRVFDDLLTETPPKECENCHRAERHGFVSYRNHFTQFDGNLTHLDIRNTNHCNLKCRICGPHFSDKWAKEINHTAITVRNDFSDCLNYMITDSLSEIYFTGGEPMLNPDHWNLLQRCVDAGLAANISLRYNTNLTTLKYKDIDIVTLWRNFNSVSIKVSLESVGDSYKHLRSGASWETVEQNLDELITISDGNIGISVAVTLSCLNLWFINDTVNYFNDRKIPVNVTPLYGPDFLSLSVLPDELLERAVECIIDVDKNGAFEKLIRNNSDKHLFRHTIAHVLLLDKLRDENLFDFLPFKDVAKRLLLTND